MCVCSGDRSAGESLRRLPVPVLVRSQQERDPQGDARRLRAAYGVDVVADVSARLRRRRPAHAGATDDRSPADTPATGLDRRLAPVQDHARGSSVAR